MKELKLQNIAEMSNEELKIAIDSCFDYAPEATSVDRLAILQEAQFYTRELERREQQREWKLAADDRTLEEKRHRAGRHLELVVISLIGLELVAAVAGIWITVRESKAQDELARQNLETMLEMNSATQRQVGQLLPISLEIVCDDSEHLAYNIVVDNVGRTGVELLGHRFGDKKSLFLKRPSELAPEYFVQIDDEAVRSLADTSVRQHAIRLQVFFRKDSEKFIAETYVRYNDSELGRHAECLPTAILRDNPPSKKLENPGQAERFPFSIERK
jgi:hypothetical protein